MNYRSLSLWDKNIDVNTAPNSTSSEKQEIATQNRTFDRLQMAINLLKSIESV